MCATGQDRKKTPVEDKVFLTLDLAAVDIKREDPELDNELAGLLSLLGDDETCKPRLILPGLITRFMLGLMPSKVEKSLLADNHMVHGLPGDVDLTDVVVVGNILSWTQTKPKDQTIDWWTDKVSGEDVEHMLTQLKSEAKRISEACAGAKLKEEARAQQLRHDELLQKQQAERQACEELTTVEEEELHENIECEPCHGAELAQKKDVFCWVCRMTLNGPLQFNMKEGNHVTGKKHQKNVNRTGSLTLEAMTMRDKLPCDMVVNDYAKQSKRIEERVVISAGHTCSVRGAPGGPQSAQKSGRRKCNNCQSEMVPKELRINRYFVKWQ